MTTLSPRTVYVTAWSFFTVATLLGLALRVHVLWPIPGLTYGYVLHGHSHMGFLGWIYNAFFALALHSFVPAGEQRGYVRLFWVTQLATVGMLVTFPLQGYARESIVFSSLHVACEVCFGWKLLRSNTAGPAARVALGWAFLFLFLSAAGPTALGPMAAAGWRGTPAYTMAIYVYLHFQYNGWFVFFLLAVIWQWRAGAGGLKGEADLRRAVLGTHALAVGAVFTLALSALWLGTASWVNVAGVIGGACQIAGALLAWKAMGSRWLRETQPMLRPLLGLAAFAFLTKLALQFLAGWPAFSSVAVDRWTAIGFLHLVFLGVITPALLALAIRHGWVRVGIWGRGGLGVLLAGAILTEIILFLPGLAGLTGIVPPLDWTTPGLAFAGFMMFGGAVVLLLTGFVRDPSVRSGP